MKTFVLDTNVLLYDPNAIFVFADNEIVLPLCVMEEIDEQKKRVDEVGRNSRCIARSLDELRKANSLLDGVKLENSGLLRIEISPSALSDVFPTGLDPQKVDNQILALALHLKNIKNNPVILVSKDITMRIKADALGLLCQDYERHKVDVDNFYTGAAVLETDTERINNFYTEGRLIAEDTSFEFEPNQNITIVDRLNPSHSGLGRYNSSEKAILPLKSTNVNLWGIKARNREQQFAIDMLLDDSLQIVTLIGIAGTGKTLLALAAGLTKVIKNEQYHKLLITRPIIPVGKDIGFLPGDVEAKLMPRMQPISDNLAYLFSLQHEERFSNISLESLIDDKIIELEALSYIRGRSIPNQFIIVDEAQNLTPHEIKTIITRAGNGTKIVITGDHYQIDNPYLDSCSNGLTYLVERFKGADIFGHITLIKGERSPLAELAAELLD
ncbi:phosphate starvation-inducible protein PhoH [Candidatus Desantisbacteria bacterium CG_4_8_14_3_um_filter_40_12]|uniref:Phosphate starvation-inducible protein PhoH n=1 Tax=Candidatus Desantisbacteria bacterium CG_4_8_14_3_um_filter_40_12 TaxID=1974545 RepID=A0A2M7J8S6_9BACT|nr:MAG: phosphate starvation-inducible protein PhoH [Candidatus Desantisbacteria bacterium CG_4_8_14_3_um_filter_40_12]